MNDDLSTEVVLFNQLVVRLLLEEIPDQVGVIVKSQQDFDNKKFVLFHNKNNIVVLELEDQSLEEFTTISYGRLN
jgi:hypothetical protein